MIETTKHIDKLTLEILNSRLKNLVSPIDIIDWLTNFSQSEYEMAIKIVSQLNVFTEFEIEEILDNQLANIIKTYNKGDIIWILPISDFGKSGTMIIYFIQKTSTFKKNKNRIKLISDINQHEQNVGELSILLLVDDFIGSGQTVKEFYENEIINHNQFFTSLVLLAICGMNVGIRNIDDIFNDIRIPRANRYKKAFSANALML